MNKVENFMAQLSAQQAPMMKKSQKTNEKKLEKIALNFPGNFGRYQILPVDNIVTDYPFVTLFNTYEICMPRTYKAADGTEEIRPTWIKIIPKEGYIMKDATGRVVPSLTNEEETLLYQARTLFDELYSELDVKNNQDVCKDLIRRRNYTIFNGYCSQRWSEGNQRQPDREKFSALFIATAKGFVTEVSKNIEEKKFETGDDQASFLGGIYNRDTENRGGCIMMTIGKAQVGVGFDVSVNHVIGANPVKDYKIPAEDMELMLDPTATFLGWQAKYEDDTVAPENRRLFNAPLTKEVIEFMTHKLAAVRSAKSAGNGLDPKAAIAQAIQTTNQAATANAQPTSNDPMLQQQATPNPANIQANNDAPFQTPPVFHADPTTGAPVNNANTQQATQAAPFAAPSFANFGAGQQAGATNGSFPF